MEKLAELFHQVLVSLLFFVQLDNFFLLEGLL